MDEERTRKYLRQVEHILGHLTYMFRSTFLCEVFNYGRLYELAENDLDILAMFLQIINNVCRKIITVLSIFDQQLPEYPEIQVLSQRKTNNE